MPSFMNIVKMVFSPVWLLDKEMDAASQYVPKKRSMNTVDEEEITMIQNRLNNRPRKRLGFKTPSEVFHQSLKRDALRT